MRAYIVIGLLLLAAASAQAQTMGELNAAQGVHHSLAGRGVSNHGNTLKKARESVKRSNARHNSAIQAGASVKPSNTRLATGKQARASAKPSNTRLVTGKQARASAKPGNARLASAKPARARVEGGNTVRGRSERR